MRLLLFCFLALLFVVSLKDPRLSAGWVWDSGNAAGFAAMAGILFLSSPGGARLAPTQHRRIAFVLVFFVAAHVLWFLFLDSAVIEYLKPGAPAYMWSGMLAAVLTLALVLLALMPTRVSVHKSYARFRNWHRCLAVLAIFAATHHLIGSGLYLRTIWQGVLLFLLCLAVVLGRGIMTQNSRVNLLAFLSVASAFMFVFVAIRLL